MFGKLSFRARVLLLSEVVVEWDLAPLHAFHVTPKSRYVMPDNDK